MEEVLGLVETPLSRIVAVVALVVVAAGTLAILVIHVAEPQGAMAVEISAIGALTAMYWVLVVFAWRRDAWSYLVSILVPPILPILGITASLSYTMFFSWSIYNLSTIILCFAAVVGAVASYLAYKQTPRGPWRRTAIRLGGVLAAGILSGAVLMLAEGSMRRAALKGISEDLAALGTVEEKLELLVEKWEIPSLVAGIVINDSLVWSKGFNADPNNDVYLIASVTKPFVATAVLQLYERGLIDLDDDVNQYLPFVLRHPTYPETAITIRMLLSHRSGLAHYTDAYRSYVDDEAILSWGSEKLGWNVLGYDPYPSFAEFLEGYLTPGGEYYSQDAWKSFEPGTQLFYSSLGFDILGLVVETVSGQVLEEYLQEYVLDSLGMTNSGFDVSDLDKQALPHERLAGVFSKTIIELPLYDRHRIGGGGIRSTVPDLARFMIAHMNEGKFNDVQLLEPGTVELMHELTVSLSEESPLPGFGLGWILLGDTPTELLDMRGAQGHGGEKWGYQSSMWFVQEAEGGYGVVVLTNLHQEFKPTVIGFPLIYAKIEDVLLTEAHRRFTSSQQ